MGSTGGDLKGLVTVQVAGHKSVTANHDTLQITTRYSTVMGCGQDRVNNISDLLQVVLKVTEQGI
jgi:hypothetical protein